jgi:prevent-host-death family protein
MESFSLADAKTHLSELVERAAAGDPVTITRRGKQVARIVATRKPRKKILLADLQAVTATMAEQPESAGIFVRRMRDEDRY